MCIRDRCSIVDPTGSWITQSSLLDKVLWNWPDYEGDIVTVGGPLVNIVTNYFNDFSFGVFVGSVWPQVHDMSWWDVLGSVVPGGILSPSCKSLFYDYKDEAGAEHYFALVSLVTDMNLTWEDTDGDQVVDWPDEICSPEALIVAGLRPEGTRMASNYIAHIWTGSGVFPTGTVALILEFIDFEQDGHVDYFVVAKVIGTVGEINPTTGLPIVPDILAWDQYVSD